MKIEKHKPSLHADGRDDFVESSRARERLRKEEAKLTRRIRGLCHAHGFIGEMIMYLRKRRLLAALRRRHGKYDSLFLAK